VGGKTPCTLLYTMAKTDIVRKYRDKYGLEVPNRTLAKIIFNENPQDFKSVEHARDAVRRVDGKACYKDRFKSEHLQKYMTPERPRNPYSFPEIEVRNREPYVLPLADNNILVLPDLHWPYTHIPSLNKAIDYGLEQQVNTIILLGDVLDNHQLSFFEKDPHKRSQDEEFAICKEFLRRLRDLFPAAQIYWLKGNHDVRWEKVIRMRMPEVASMPHFALESVLALHEERIHMIDDKTIVRAGKLHFHHGHQFFGRFAPSYAAKTLWDKANLEIMIGHCHTNTKYEKVTLDGVKKTFICGCLSEIGLNVDYNPIVNQYRRGFAHVKITKDGYTAELISTE
jgi:predicted phosphodiesterase